MLAGRNFGCGSSRENAVWALMGFGMRCIIAPSFGDIFFGNSFHNGLLPVRLPEDAVEQLAREIVADESAVMLTVDLGLQCVTSARGEEFGFDIEPLRKKMLLEGLDEISVTLEREAEIAAFQSRDRERRPWLYS